MDMLGQWCSELAVEEVTVGQAEDHLRLTLPDSPVTIDLLAGAAPQRVVYLLPGGGLNAVANFFTHVRRSLARFLSDHGFLVVGITPREDALPSAGSSEAREWGLASHRRDVRRVIDAIQASVSLPHDLLGHSAGAALALDTASHASDSGHAPERVLVLDTTGPYDPAGEADLVARAAALTDRCREQLEQGAWVIDPGLKGLFARARTAPEASSGVPRPTAGSAPFTNLALLHYALSRTSLLPGPANWIYQRGHSSGSYVFGASPAEDRFALDRTPLTVWTAAVEALGSGLQPTALLRDLAALWSGREEVYRIDWSAISAEVVWVNAGLGRGDHDLGARLVRAGGARVDYRVVPGYGHGDVVWATDAEQEVWEALLPADPTRSTRSAHSPR